jgi:DNA-binding ferritin-like protein
MDKVISLSAFGNVIKNPKGRESETEDTGESGAYAHIFKMALQNVAQTKLLHWQSNFYGQHKALDGLFEGLIDLTDTLAESIMGKYGKPVLNGDQCCLNIKNFENPEKGDLKDFMEHLHKCYAIDCKSLLDPEKDPELLNIVDEIIALVDQTKYLVSLR